MADASTTSAPRLLVLEAGGANFASVAAALDRLGADWRRGDSAEDLADADAVLLPGVGAAAPAMAGLEDRGLAEALRGFPGPMLGICLGMQLLLESSEEGADDCVACLGLLPGRVRRLQPGPGRTVPHMGWNRLASLVPGPLFDGVEEGDYAYFVHAYAAPAEETLTLATTEHGERFAAVVGDGRVFGCQFHPERSAAVGAKLLGNFLAISARATAATAASAVHRPARTRAGGADR